MKNEGNTQFCQLLSHCSVKWRTSKMHVKCISLETENIGMVSGMLSGYLQKLYILVCCGSYSWLKGDLQMCTSKFSLSSYSKPKHFTDFTVIMTQLWFYWLAIATRWLVWSFCCLFKKIAETFSGVTTILFFLNESMVT